VVYQERSIGSYFHPAHYTSPGNHVDDFLYGTPQGGLFNTSPPQLPPENHHPQSSPLISGQPACNLWGTRNTELPHGFPLVVRQAVKEFIGGSMSSIQPPALSPQVGFIDVLPIQKRRVRRCHCPVSGCLSSLGRAQEQRRHLLTHLPHWIHCPAPDCSWRGDRLRAFVRHWSRDHPSSSQVPQEDQCKIYDPLPLIKEIAEGSLCVQAAQKYAISMVQKKASELGKPELCQNPWGRRWRKQRKAQ
jgi:hypothetical protein